MKSRFVVFIAFLIGLVMMSCCSFNALRAPYVITEERVTIGEEEGVFSSAGAFFTLYNNTDKTMCSCTLSFRIYDYDGEASTVGGNLITTDFKGIVLPKTTEQIVVSLDDMVSGELADGYQFDFVYVSRILFSDGSSWNDPVGVYSW